MRNSRTDSGDSQDQTLLDGITINKETGDVEAEYSVWLKLRDGELGKAETRSGSCEVVVLDANSVQ
jgi:hypothetical protein